MHESYWFDEESKTHASVVDVLLWQKKKALSACALHTCKEKFGKKMELQIQDLIQKSGLQVMVPNVGDILEV